VYLLPRPCRGADALRLSDHRRSGAPAVSRRSARDATLEVERELGRPLAESYDLERRTKLLAALADTVEALPHLHETLDAIEARMCVASSAAHEKIFTTLSRVGLYARFAPNIFSGSQVRFGKPAPDLFLFAARQMPPFRSAAWWSRTASPALPARWPPE